MRRSVRSYYNSSPFDARHIGPESAVPPWQFADHQQQVTVSSTLIHINFIRVSELVIALTLHGRCRGLYVPPLVIFFLIPSPFLPFPSVDLTTSTSSQPQRCAEQTMAAKMAPQATFPSLGINEDIREMVDDIPGSCTSKKTSTGRIETLRPSSRNKIHQVTGDTEKSVLES